MSSTKSWNRAGVTYHQMIETPNKLEGWLAFNANGHGFDLSKSTDEKLEAFKIKNEFKTSSFGSKLLGYSQLYFIDVNANTFEKWKSLKANLLLLAFINDTTSNYRITAHTY